MTASATRDRRRDPDHRAEAQRGPPASSHHRVTRSRAGPAATVASGHDLGRCVVRPPVPAPRPQLATAVSSPGDAVETYADTVAARVLRGAPPAVLPGPAAFGLSRAAGASGPAGGDFAAGLPPAVDRVLAAPHGGTPIPPALRRRIEPHVGADLGAVRVLTGPRASVAAASLGARAFTAGSTIVLGRGESASDTRLMAHEATHVAQQAGAPGRHGVHRATIMRDVTDLLPDLPDISVTDLVPQSILDGVTAALRSIPGYTLLTQVIGTDPLTGAPVEADRQAMIDELLAYGPFGAAVGQALQGMDALGEVVTLVTDSLGQYRLTFTRLKEDIDAAWAQFSIGNGIEGNVAIVGRVVEGILADVRAFVTDLVERILAIVRDAVLDLVEPLLTGNPTIAPVWSLATKVFHYDPLRGVPVEAATVDILADFLHLIGQDAALDQMRERGTLQETADWLDTQIATFLSLLEQATTLFSDAWAAIQPENLGTLLDTLPDLAQRAFALVVGIGTFAGTVLLKVLELVKHSLLGMLSGYAYAIPGFRLVSVIIGHNPFTGEEVPLTAENLIGGFITLMPGGEATYQQLSETGVIGEAAARIESAMATLGITWDLITSTFLGLWDTLSLAELLTPIDVFQRVVALFGQPIARIVEFIIVVVQVVIELVLRLMNFPSDLLASIITQTVQAITDIQRDPVGFLLHMLEALKAGFQGFFDNVLGYLLQGLVSWLFRGLAELGITIPTEISFASILGLVLDVLGLSVDFVWRKLGEHLGEDKVAMIRDGLNTLGGAWTFLKDVQERGIVAIWEYVIDQLSTLWSTILSMATEWIMTTIIANATVKLLSMLDPSGVMAVVNSCIAFFNAVQSAIEYIRDILEIVNMYVSTFAAVARGDITPGAQMIEQGLAAVIPVAIGFLAAQVGLGGVPDRIAEIIRSIRDVVEAAIDWLIEQALSLGTAALEMLNGRAAAEPEATHEAERAVEEKLRPDAGPIELAQAMLRTSVTDGEHPDDIRAELARVLEELGPAGLSGLELRGPDEDGQYQLAASASPWVWLATMFETIFAQRRSAYLRVTLHVSDAQTALQNVEGADPPERFARRFRTTGRTQPPLLLDPVQAQGPSFGSHDVRRRTGGIVAPPARGAEDRLEVLTFNTGETFHDETNDTHAERQLEEFLERNSEAGGLADRVKAIDAGISLSPCTMCSGTLSNIADLTPNANGRRALRWHDLYVNARIGTDDGSLGRIRDWTVTPMPIPEAARDAAERQRRTDAAHWLPILG